MRREERVRLLAILKDGVANGGAVHGDGIVESPLEDFTCPELFAEEQQVFFRETPLLMGLSGDLPENGSYWADSQTGLPILMTRDDDGRFRAFANTCRHRGAQVVPDGRGAKARFSCPFHAWTYSSRGDLIAVTRAERFGDFDKAGRGLIELPAAEKHGMLWVRPTPGDDIDVDAMLGGLQDDMAHWELPEHSYGASQVIPANVNWKLAVDTFGENYHFDVLHRETLANDVHGNLQTHDIFEQNYRMVFANTYGFAEASAQEPNVENWPFRRLTLSVYFIYPSTIFLVDGAGVDIVRIYPDADDVRKSHTAQSFYPRPQLKEYFEDPEFPERYQERFDGFNRVVVNEDYQMAEATQRCANAGIQTHTLFGRNEPGLLHYHNAHRRGLGKPLLEVQSATANGSH